MTIDATLLPQQRVLPVDEQPDNLGYEVHLECGHTIWSARYPTDPSSAESAWITLVQQVRGIQAQQKLL